MITICVGPKTTLKQVKLDVMRQVLAREGSVTRAAQVLKVDLKTYYNLLGKAGIRRVKKNTPDG